MVKLLLLLILGHACLVYGGVPATRASEFQVQDGQFIRVTLGEIIPRERLGSIAQTSDATRFQPISLELRTQAGTFPLRQFLRPESASADVQGFDVLAAAVEPKSVVLVCTTGVVLHVKCIPVLGSGEAQDTILPGIEWRGSTAVLPLQPGEVTATLQRSRDGSRWVLNVVHGKRRSTFEQDATVWKFTRQGGTGIRG